MLGRPDPAAQATHTRRHHGPDAPAARLNPDTADERSIAPSGRVCLAVKRSRSGGSSPLVALCMLALSGPASAQIHAHDPAPLRLHGGASAIVLLTRADPALAGRAFTEGYLTRPILSGNAAWRGLEARAMLNFERWTLDRGELNAGVSGEGYIDRRHPHTFLHEATLSATGETAGFAASLTAGLGFAPFGTDDPMVRPFVKYPANHHLAQILERWIATGAVRRGRLVVEAGLFNGDEPADPRSPGRISRLADSWAARLTLLPIDGVEVQGSHARVESPEHGTGGGLDHRKWSASVRGAGSLGGRPVYALLEWARTDEHTPRRRAFSFVSALAEARSEVGGFGLAARLERTTRAEEERLEDPFRSARPHADDNIVGVTRWRSATLNIERPLDVRGIGLEPFAEVSFLHAEEITGSVFDAAEFFGAANQWSLSAGVRIGIGTRHDRMGRYGVAMAGT